MADAKPVASMDELEASQDVEYATVEGYAKDAPIRIGSLTAGDLIEWSEANQEGGEKKRTMGLRLIVKSLVNADGVRYAMGSPEIETRNVNKLRGKNHKTSERIVEEILKLNGMTVKADAEAKKE